MSYTPPALGSTDWGQTLNSIIEDIGEDIEELETTRRTIPDGASAGTINDLIEDAHDELDDWNLGTGVVYGRSQELEISSSIVMRSGVYLVDCNFVASDSLGSTMVISDGFGSDQNSNGWIVGQDDIPHNYGLVRCTLDGNRGNRDSGAGIKFYGKRMLLDRVLVFDQPEEGIWTEAGASVGQSDVRDMPFGHFTIFCRNNGGDGFRHRGPHDSSAPFVVSSANGGHGIACEQEPDTYSGAGLKIGWSHTFGHTNGNYGYYLPANVKGNHLTAEDDVYLGERHSINRLHMARSNAEVDAPGIIGMFYARGAGVDRATTALDITDDRVVVNGAWISGYDDGIVIDGDQVSINGGFIENIEGGHAVVLGDTGSVNRCNVNLRANGAPEGALYVNSAGRNTVSVKGFVGSSDTGWDSDSSSPDDKDMFDVAFTGSGDGTGASVEAGAAIVDGHEDTISIDLVDDPAYVLLGSSAIVPTLSYDNGSTDSSQIFMQMYDSDDEPIEDTRRITYRASIGGML